MRRLTMCIYLILASILYANFQVAPSIQEVSLDRTMTRKIYLKNNGDKLKKIKIYSRMPEDQKTSSLYMGDWVIVYPKVVYLKPNSKKTIRMGVRHPQGLADGEYRSHLVFEELPLEKHDSNDSDESQKRVQVEVMYEIISTVYGYKGKLQYGGTFDNFKIVEGGEKTHLASKITNTGTAALDVFYRVTSYKNEKDLKTQDVRVKKVMRENNTEALVELEELSEDADQVRVEYYYRVAKKGGEAGEYEMIKLGEKTLPVERMSMEEYQEGLEVEKEEKEV